MSIGTALLRYAQTGGRDVHSLIGALHGDRMRREREAQQMTQLQGQASKDPEIRAQAFGGTTIPPARGGRLPSSGNPQIDKVLAAAHSQIGTPYVWGAETPGKGFDCSGLIDWAYRTAGIDFPGRMTTRTALSIGRSVRSQPWKPGDMLIVNHGEHMVMYVGHGKVIAAPHTGEVVQYQPASSFANSIVDVRRVG